MFICFFFPFLCLLQVGDENKTLPYWLSNASALLCLLQRNLRSNGFLTATAQRSAGSTGLPGRVAYVCLLAFFYLFIMDYIISISDNEAMFWLVNCVD